MTLTTPANDKKRFNLITVSLARSLEKINCLRGLPVPQIVKSVPTIPIIEFNMC